MEATDHGLNRGGPQERSRVLRGIDDPRVPAPVDDDQAILGVDHDRGVLWDRVFHCAGRALQQQPLRPVALPIGAWGGPAEPDTRYQLGGATVLNERPAARLIRGPQRQQAIGLLAVGRETLEANQWRGIWPNIRDFRFNLDDVRWGVGGDQGWAIATWSSTGFDRQGHPFDRPGRATVIFRRDGDNWLALHTHFSLCPGTPTTTHGPSPSA